MYRGGNSAEYSPVPWSSKAMQYMRSHCSLDQMHLEVHVCWQCTVVRSGCHGDIRADLNILQPWVIPKHWSGSWACRKWEVWRRIFAMLTVEHQVMMLPITSELGNLAACYLYSAHCRWLLSWIGAWQKFWNIFPNVLHLSTSYISWYFVAGREGRPSQCFRPWFAFGIHIPVCACM